MRFLCRFSLILFALIYASSASYSSGNSDYAKVEIISIGVYSNLNGKLDFKLRSEFKRRLNEFEKTNDIIFISLKLYTYHFNM